MGVRQARVVVGAVCALVLACVDALDASAPRPHFVFILQDDLGEFAVFVVFETHALSRIAACCMAKLLFRNAARFRACAFMTHVSRSRRSSHLRL